ncbi:MAG TPA: ATPase domain-containing protein, partial [Polyangiaceae bacterium]|nr:ATPase domain-containing protein [Polyangiaceae bacterium]
MDKTQQRCDAGDPTHSTDMVPTNIEGLDAILLGGFRREGVYLIQGDPGSGKTTLALQFVQGRVQAGESCLYVSLTETRQDLENTCRSHGWSLDGLQLLDLTRSLSDSAEGSV